MGDTGIVIITVGGDDALGDLHAALNASPGARILELRVRDDATARQLEAFSRVAEDRGMRLLLRESGAVVAGDD
jgi:hypothetical protein